MGEEAGMQGAFVLVILSSYFLQSIKMMNDPINTGLSCFPFIRYGPACLHRCFQEKL